MQKRSLVRGRVQKPSRHTGRAPKRSRAANNQATVNQRSQVAADLSDLEREIGHKVRLRAEGLAPEKVEEPTRVGPAELQIVPLADVLPIGAHIGLLYMTMAPGQSNLLLRAAYAVGSVLLEIGENNEPVRAYRKPGTEPAGVARYGRLEVYQTPARVPNPSE